MKLLKFLLCGLIVALPVFAEESEDRQTATSLHYVSHELDTRQNKLSAGPNAALTYTNTAGNVEQRTVKSDLTGGTTDTSLPQVNAVNAGLGTKQNDISTIDDHTAVTYTSQVGTIGQKGIYQADGTYIDQTDNLIDAKTFNAALKNGLDNEFVCADRPDAYAPGTTNCWLWEIHNGATRILPQEYTQLEFIESTGTQYIDTGYNFNSSLKFDVEFEKTGDNTGDTTGGRSTVLFGTNGHQNECIIGWSGAVYLRGQSAVIGFSPALNTKHTVVADFTIGANQVIIDGVVRANSTSTRTNNGKLFLFGVITTTNPSATGTPETFTQQRIYSFKLWNDGVLVRNFIPAKRNSDNVLGMYDIVSGALFENDGTGTFIAGPVTNTNIYLPQNQQ